MPFRVPAPTVVGMNETAHLADASRRSRLTAAHETAPAGNVSVIVAELTAVRCRWCNDDLEHCHDSLVVHGNGDSHCMDATCESAAEAHHMIVRCDEFSCDCARVAAGMADTA